MTCQPCANYDYPERCTEDCPNLARAKQIRLLIITILPGACLILILAGAIYNHHDRAVHPGGSVMDVRGM